MTQPSRSLAYFSAYGLPGELAGKSLGTVRPLVSAVAAIVNPITYYGYDNKLVHFDSTFIAQHVRYSNEHSIFFGNMQVEQGLWIVRAS